MSVVRRTTLLKKTIPYFGTVCTFRFICRKAHPAEKKKKKEEVKPEKKGVYTKKEGPKKKKRP